MSAETVLIVEDDDSILEGLRFNLEAEGYCVVIAKTGTEAIEQFERHAPDLVLLDVMLPELDGFGVLRVIRRADALTPVLVLSARDHQHDKVHGLEIGADDYITKPFLLPELLARIKSVIRRLEDTSPPPAERSPALGPQIAFGECSLDLDAHKLYGGDGQEITITSMEFDLLKAFADNPNKVLSRDQLLYLAHNRVWEPFDRLIFIRITRFPLHIQPDPATPPLITPVSGAASLYLVDPV